MCLGASSMRSLFMSFVIVLLLWPGLARAADTDIDGLMRSFDWDRIGADGIRLLGDYIRIDNTNPPGDEIEAARFLARLLEEDEIATSIHSSERGRANLLARLPGRGSRKPILLMSHSDVVPAAPDRWNHPPFSGAVVDGYLWGRGTIDTKSLTIIQYLALREFKRAGIELDRDLLLLAQADEEMGGGKGVGWLVEELPELLEIEYVLDEGGTGIAGLAVPVRTIASIITAEKGVVWIRLTSRGDAGHASVPWEINAVQRLARAVVRASDWEQGISLSATSRTYLERLIASTGAAPPADAGELLAQAMALASVDALPRRKLVAIASNTINPTQLRAGAKTNVVPAQAAATLDCRIVPGQSVEDFVTRLTERIDDPLVQVEVMISAEATESPIDTPLFEAIQMAVSRRIDDSITVPYMALGGSDSRFFRERGITAYGFHPAMLDEEDFLAHQPNERINLEKFHRAIQIYLEVLLRIGLETDDDAE